MRKLMWFVLGYGAACALGTYLLRGWGILIPGALALILGTAVMVKFPDWQRLGLCGLGIAAGCAAFWIYSLTVLAPALAVDGQIVPIELTVADYSWETDYGSAVDGTIALEGKTYKIRFYLSETMELEPSDVLQTNAKLRLTDEGGSREPTFHRTNGILLLGYQRGSDLTVINGEPGWREFAAVVRKEIKNSILRCFPENAGGFAKALLLGDKTDLSHELTTAFSISGISHIVAVSGLHVSILFSLIYPAAGKRRFLTAVIGIPSLLLFAAVAGFTPSVTRAVIMQCLMILALLLNREYDPPNALAFAALVMLVQNPLVIASVGFQLSVGSVAGIFLFSKGIKEWLTEKYIEKGKCTFRKRLLHGLFSGVSVTLGATFITTPLVAVYFHTISLVGILTNLLVLFVISAIFYGVMLVSLTAVFSKTVASAIAWAVSWLIRYVLGIANALASLPLAAVYTDSPYVVIWLVFVYGLAGWLLVTKNKQPAIAVLLASISLCISLIVSWMEPLLWDYRVTVLDVGQGQCILLQSEGYTFVVDCGGDYDQDAGDAAAQTLLSMGISRVDGLILTHYDRDHAGGVQYLAERVKIDRIYLPPTEDTDGLLDEVLDSTRDSEQIVIENDITLSFNHVTIEILAPELGDSRNESCAVVLFRSEKCDTLITGDISAFRERQLIAEHDIPDLELLIVGHHGSKYSTCQELLAATAPDVAIISVGASNSYGHPTQEVLDRLENAGCVVYRTDFDGTVTYRGCANGKTE